VLCWCWRWSISASGLRCVSACLFLQLDGIAVLFSRATALASAWVHLLCVDFYAATCVRPEPNPTPSHQHYRHWFAPDALSRDKVRIHLQTRRGNALGAALAGRLFACLSWASHSMADSMCVGCVLWTCAQAGVPRQHGVWRAGDALAGAVHDVLPCGAAVARGHQGVGAARRWRRGRAGCSGRGRGRLRTLVQGESARGVERGVEPRARPRWFID
jgi:hypothetical protein